MGSISQQSAELQAIAALCQGAIALSKTFCVVALNATQPQRLDESRQKPRMPQYREQTRATRARFT